AAARAAADKANADKAAAEKALAEKQRAVQAAQEAILAEQAYAANEAVTKATTEKAAAEKAVTEKTAAAQKASTDAAPAKTAADKAAGERAAAEKALAEKSAAAQAAADKLGAAKAAAEKAPGDKPLADQLTAAKTVAEKASADKAAAEKSLADKTTAAKAADEKSAAAKTAADKAATAKTDAEAAVPLKAAALQQALDNAAKAAATLAGGLTPLPAKEWDYAKARHLLWRAGFGGSPEEVSRLHAMGLHAAVDYLVDYQKQPEPNVWVHVSTPEYATPFEHRLTPAERTKLENDRTSRRFAQQSQMRQWWLRRMVESPRPLQEKLALFWHGLFAVSFQKAEMPYFMYRQNQLFREHAAGSYGALLRGVAQDPAMINYLDNHVNFKGAGNENLGREILELFSMGEGQGYTEQGLREASRALTGYSYEHHTGQFKLIAARHDETPKTIFGRSGNWGGDDLVDMVLQQPHTARFISMRLFRYLAHDNPSPETVESLAKVLRTYHYDLAPMLKNLFLSEEFYSGNAMASHIKSPAELMVGTARTLGLTQVNYGNLDSALQNMGQTLFEPPNVKGWDGGRDWINASRVLTRYNAVAALVDQASVDVVGALSAKQFNEAGEVVDYLANGFLVMPLSPQKRTELVQYLGQLPASTQWAAQRDAINAKLRAVLATLLSTPEYQLSQAAPETIEPLNQYRGISSPTRLTVLPLPKGEGRGEGEGSVIMPATGESS
ncbi:MAG: DUF1800 family protein, partial [Verrucomicrobiota bacterium]